MKLRLQIASLGLLSLIAVPVTTHTMAGRMVGTFVGTGGALASYWAYQNTDRLGSVFTRTDRLLASAVEKPTESAAQAITNATSGQTLSQLGGAIGKQAEQLTSALSTIASSRILTTALIAGSGYLVINQIHKFITGDGIKTRKMLEKVKDALANAIAKSKDEILAKMSEYTQNIKGWITKEVKSDGQKTRGEMADGFGAVNTKLANLDADTKNQFDELAAKLNLTKEQIESLLALKLEDLKEFIAESNKTIQLELTKQINELRKEQNQSNEIVLKKLEELTQLVDKTPKRTVFAMQNHFKPQQVSMGTFVN